MRKGYITARQQGFEAIEHCISTSKNIPALILIYTLMDNAAWLSERNRSKQVGDRFKDWADSYLLPNSKLKATSSELYSARCSILHTLTTDVKKKDDSIRGIQYAFGDIETEPLQNKLDAIKKNSAIVIHINDLYDSYRKSLEVMLEQIKLDAEWNAEVDLRSAKAYASLHNEDADRFADK